MAYATENDATELYGADYVLTSIDRDADGSVDTDSFAAALAQASSQIDSYLGTKYDVPISPIPDLLVRLCIDIGIYQSCPAATRTEEKRERYDDAIAWLKDVAKGIAVLGLPTATAPVTNAVAVMSADNPPRLFSRRKMGML